MMARSVSLGKIVLVFCLARFVGATHQNSGGSHTRGGGAETHSVELNWTEPAETKYDPAQLWDCSNKLYQLLIIPLVRLEFAVSLGNWTTNSTTQGLQVLYHQQASESDYSKRAVSRAINYCPPGHTFLYSRCSRHHSVQGWSLLCLRQPGVPPGNGLLQYVDIEISLIPSEILCLRHMSCHSTDT